MSEIIQTSSMTLPLPSAAITVRVGTREDLAFMDALQKKHSKALGFFPRAQMEGYIDGGNVLIASWHEPVRGTLHRPAHDDCGGVDSATGEAPVPRERGERVGYVIAKDRYLKRDELGAVFQLCVVPGKQRSFIGANLLREVFERSAYGCKLYCCWCAQDLPANRFWEAMGFVPIAYRAGGLARRAGGRGRIADCRLPISDLKTGDGPAFQSEIGNRKSAMPRVHIFWQKRIRAGDVTTPYWFPAKTEGGAIREDRIILPIPPGMRWDDELPVLLPGGHSAAAESDSIHPSAVSIPPSSSKRLAKAASIPPSAFRLQPSHSIPPSALSLPPSSPGSPPSPPKRISTPNGIWMAPAKPIPVQPKPAAAPPETPTKTGRTPRERRVEAKPDRVNPKAGRVKAKANPALIARARELRDRWMDHVAAHGGDPLGTHGHGKYDVTRIPAPAPASKRLAA